MSVQENKKTRKPTCPDCGGNIVADPKHGERTCVDCGMVVSEGSIDHGPEWRSYSFAEDQERSRTGPPMDRTGSETMLSTSISWRDVDARGNLIGARKRRRMHRLRRMQSQSSDSTEQYQKQATAEIERMGAALGLPTDVRETATDIFRLSQTNGVLRGRSVEALTSASLHIAASNVRLPRSLGEIELVSRIDRNSIARAKRAINTKLGLAVEPGAPEEYVERFGSELDVGHRTVFTANRIIESASDEYIGSGANPVAIAAGAIYTADRMTGGSCVTQQEVSDTTDVCIMTIRKHKSELLSQYEC